jgi:uncharacterized membrane-anchored protein
MNGSTSQVSVGIQSKMLVFAILFPIVLLLGFMLHKQRVVSQGARVILKIVGYDPRDLLSGHYLIYNVDYGVTPTCTSETHLAEAFVCLSDKTFRFGSVRNCDLAIAGKCEQSRFVAGIERFYVPQENARELEQHVMGRNASIELAIKNGQAQVVDLLIEGVSWKDKLKEPAPSDQGAQ